MELRDIEPFYGWQHLYQTEKDTLSPFYEVTHSEFYYDRFVNGIPMHPQWEDFGSESLLCKIIYANYKVGFAIIELVGEWNDLFENDYKLFAENCLTYLVDNGIDKIVLICENVFHIYLQDDDYYDAMQEEMGEEGWICLLKPREEVVEEMTQYHILDYFFWSQILDEVNWRALNPLEILKRIEGRMRLVLDE